MIRERIRFSGSVQGVGFRYRARHAAESLGLTGWVYNDSDGSVQMEIQGDQETIDRMIVMINKGLFIAIDNVERTEIAVDEAERSFAVLD